MKIPAINTLQWINVRDYGATGNGTADDGPAFQRALDAAKAASGGTVYAPPGRYRITTPINLTANANHEDEIVIRGSAGSALFIDTAGAFAFLLTSFGTVKLVDMAVVPYNPLAVADAVSVFCTSSVYHTVIEDCLFVGLQTTSDVVLGDYSGIEIRRSSFRGCGASRGVVTSFHSRLVSVEDAYFVDYGSWGGTGYNLRGANTAWVRIGTPIVPSPPYDSINSGVIALRRCGFDEGASHALRADSGGGGALIPRIDIEDCDNLIGVAASVYVDGCRTLVVNQMAWNNQGGARDAANLANVHRADFSHCDVLNSGPGAVTNLTAAASCGTVYLYESDNVVLASSAATTVNDVNGVRTIT